MADLWLPSDFVRRKGQFGRYAVGEQTSQRRDPGTTIKTADALLTEQKRKRTIEGGRDLQRNYSVAAWAVRKHLDYVSTFTFQANTDDPAFNERLEYLMDWWSRPNNCDVAGRNSFRRFVRLAEARRVLDGDVFLVKFRDGRLQAVEGDRVRTPEDAAARYDGQRVVHGVRLSSGGRMASIAVHQRTDDGRYVFERDVPARNFIQLGYIDNFDQVRGVSPLTTAIHQFQDVAEVTNYARAKAKVTQLFALAITRKESDFDDWDSSTDGYDINMGEGPVKLELDPGDEASFLESKHPSTEFQQFMELSLQAALKSLDIPWSFYDESYTNFFGSRSALIQYQQACRAKREDLVEMLNRLTAWRISLWIAAGQLVLPRSAATIGDLKWDWIPAGVPWWNPEQEINGDILAIQNGLRTRSEIRRERYGDDWRNVVTKLAEEERFMAELGMQQPPKPQAQQDIVNVDTSDDGENSTLPAEPQDGSIIGQ